MNALKRLAPLQVQVQVLVLVAGVLFGVGLQWAGMTDPRKVLAFLDVAGTWDPSLVLVMGAAAGTTFLLFPLILRRERPWLDTGFHLSPWRALDAPLGLGAALFGIGWGIAGYCPGPALAGVVLGNGELAWFLPAFALGVWLGRRGKV